MGIHFACHHCNHALHVKDFQGGKRGKCPSCKNQFRIPIKDASYSSAIEDPSYEPSAALVQQGLKAATESHAKRGSLTSESGGTEGIDAIDGRSESSVGVAEVRVRQEGQINSVTSPNKNKKIENTAVPPPPDLTRLMEFPNSQWFVRPPSGGQFGPATTSLLVEWVKENRVTGDSLLWCEGMTQWQLASELLHGKVAPVVPPSTSIPLAENGVLADIDPIPASLSPNSTAPVVGVALKKKIQKRRQQVNMIIFLGIVSLILLSILIYVLVSQVAKS